MQAFKYFTGLIFLLLHGSVMNAQSGHTIRILAEEYLFNEQAFGQCHASTLAETPDGLIAACFGGSHEGASDVCIWTSFRDKNHWQPARRIACGSKPDGTAIACWNPVFFSANQDSLFLYFKQGASPRDWQCMRMLSCDHGQTWSEPVYIPGLTGPVKNKPIVTKQGNWLFPASKESTLRWQVYIERSADKGKSWDVIPLDTANPAKVIQPCLLTYADGRIQALCRSDQDCILESWSADDGKSWSQLRKTKLANPNSGIDGVTLTSGLQVLVYNPGTSGKEWWNGRNKLQIAVSEDGITWSVLYTPEDRPEGEFSYPAIIQSKDGILHLTYTYNRTKIKHIAFVID